MDLIVFFLFVCFFFLEIAPQVIALITAAQETSPALVAQALDKVTEFFFYRVLLNFTFGVGFIGFLSRPTGFYRVFFGFTGFLPGIYRFDRVLLGFTEFLLDLTGF